MDDIDETVRTSLSLWAKLFPDHKDPTIYVFMDLFPKRKPHVTLMDGATAYCL
jgi:hypothetical protein